MNGRIESMEANDRAIQAIRVQETRYIVSYLIGWLVESPGGGVRVFDTFEEYKNYVRLSGADSYPALNTFVQYMTDLGHPPVKSNNEYVFSGIVLLPQEKRRTDYQNLVAEAGRSLKNEQQKTV